MGLVSSFVRCFNPASLFLAAARAAAGFEFEGRIEMRKGGRMDGWVLHRISGVISLFPLLVGLKNDTLAFFFFGIFFSRFRYIVLFNFFVSSILFFSSETGCLSPWYCRLVVSPR